jgi:hypothetical protein
MAKAAKDRPKDRPVEKRIGRPSSFTQEIADEICVRISGGESLRSIVLGSHMPDRATVFRWLVANQIFRDQYARAREAHADSLVDDMLAIADAEYESNEAITAARLKIDTRKWLAGRMSPKKYSEQKMALTGPSGDGPVQIEMQVIDPSTLAPDAMLQIQEALSLAIEAQEAPDEE